MEPEEDDGKPQAFDKWYQRLDCFHYLTMIMHFLHLTIFLVRSLAHSPHGTLWCPCIKLFSCCPHKYHYFAGTFSRPRTACHFEPTLAHALSVISNHTRSRTFCQFEPHLTLGQHASDAITLPSSRLANTQNNH